MRLALLAALVAICLAGCSEGARLGNVPIEDPLAPVPSTVALTGCKGFDTSKDSAMTEGPGNVPPGWDFDPLAEGRYFSYAAAMFLHCDIVDVRDVRREDVSLVIETHSKFSPPEACVEVRHGFDGIWWMSILHRIIVSDPVVAAALVDAGLPGVQGEIQRSDPTGPLDLQRWEWRAGGGEWSWLETQMPGAEEDPFEDDERMVSWDGSRLTLLDARWDVATVLTDVPVVHGELAPDVLMSNGQRQMFAQTADHDVVADLHGVLKQFANPDCSA